MYTVLAVCTGNSVRSIMAEVVLAEQGRGRLRAASAGSNPRGMVSGTVADTLIRAGYGPAGLRSKSWHEFAGAKAPDVDLVLALCPGPFWDDDRPAFSGAPAWLFWDVADPAAQSAEETAVALRACLAEIERRVSRLLALPFETLEPHVLRRLASDARSAVYDG